MFLRVLFLAAGSWVLLAQTFNAGSNGSDGDLTFPGAQPGDVIVFDPKNTSLFPGGLDKDNDNIYHFKTITIPAGVEVRLKATKVNGPVYWLAQENVTIAGHLNLNGEPGSYGGYVAQSFAVPGSGGFHGGGGGRIGADPTPGFGPAGGAASPCPTAGGITANEFLVPLIGGSGGSGVRSNDTNFIGRGGGAGGGAILIATSKKITVSPGGKITAKGGGLSNSGLIPGAGGTIRLAATLIEGSGELNVGPGDPVNQCCGCSNAVAGTGRIRLEAFTVTYGGLATGSLRVANPVDTFLPVGSNAAASVRVLSVAGMAVTASPTGTYAVPDVTINSEALVPVVIETTNVPAGTVVKLQVYSDNGAGQSVDFPALAGPGPVHQATVNVKWPGGYSSGFVRVSFSR